MSLSEMQVRKAKEREKAYSMADGGGLYLWVTPAGGKLWRWSYRFNRKEKLMAFGRYPDVSLSKARELHRDARALLASGIDPMAKRKQEKNADRAASDNSFQTVALQWHDHWKVGKSPRHVDYVKRRMDMDILPCLGTRPISEVEAPELVAMAATIQERGAIDIAKRALETVGQVFRYGIAHGFCRRNPAADIRPSDVLKTGRKVNYARVDAKELPALLRSIEVYRGTHVTRFALKLLALTFVRTGELIGAKWSEFDLKAARWDIPAERMKMRTPHIVPLSQQACEVLESLHDITGKTEWLFPGDRGSKKPMSNNTILKALERMGYKGRMTGHGFRGLASTLLHEQGYLHDHIEIQLAHSPRNAVSAAYNHALYLGPRTKMMQEWADFLDRTRSKAAVIPFPDRAA